MDIGDPQGLCDTTSTPRFYNPLCKCDTYPGNLGPCTTWEDNGQGHCPYCDHEQTCHFQLSAYRHGRNDIDRRTQSEIKDWEEKNL